MERIVRFGPGYDRRAQMGGFGGVSILFVLKGELGAIDFALLTDWYPEPVQREMRPNRNSFFQLKPYGFGVSYHSPHPLRDGQTITNEHCEWLDDKPCYCDGSFAVGDILAKRLLTEGDKAVWQALEERYTTYFGELR